MRYLSAGFFYNKELHDLKNSVGGKLSDEVAFPIWARSYPTLAQATGWQVRRYFGIMERKNRGKRP